MGWERELAGGAHASARGEREDAEVGRHESKKKTYFAECAKGTCGPSGPMKGTMACGRGGPAQWSWATGPDPKREFKGKNIFLNFKDFWNFGRTLRISTMRYRRNFDTRIFPKFF
jgi:hypothetical protein